MRAFLPACLILAASAAPACADEPRRDGAALYRSHCALCHDTGVNGAPRIGDKRAWQARIAEGRAAQVRRAIKGIRQMPPRGGSPRLSDAEVERAVVHLLNRSGARFED